MFYDAIKSKSLMIEDKTLLKLFFFVITISKSQKNNININK
jgi:hypothetical protein